MRLSTDIYKKGITAIELLIVITIIVILAAIIVTPFSNFRASKILDTGTEDIASLLNEARLDTLSSKNGFQYGVHIESGRLVFFRGTIFTEPDVNNKEVMLNSALEISTISLNGGGADVVFEKLTGETNQYGMIIMRVKNNITRNVTVTIESTGVVGF